MRCRHCGKPIRAGESGVNWPWIHKNGWYGCEPFEVGFRAEPEDQHEEAAR
jgi:hypothetical protein